MTRSYDPNSRPLSTVRFQVRTQKINKMQTVPVPVCNDKTAPEALISASTTTKDIVVAGTDNLSSTTVSTSTTKVIITDQAGNVTTLTFQKTYSSKLLTLAKLVNIQYGSSTPVTLPTSFTYIWKRGQAPFISFHFFFGLPSARTVEIRPYVDIISSFHEVLPNGAPRTTERRIPSNTSVFSASCIHAR